MIMTCPPKTDPIIILGSLEDKIMKKRFTTEQIIGKLREAKLLPPEGFLLSALFKKRFTTEQIIGKLREAEVLLSKGEAMETACRQIGVTDQTYYRWRKEYGGVRLD